MKNFNPMEAEVVRHDPQGRSFHEHPSDNANHSHNQEFPNMIRLNANDYSYNTNKSTYISPKNQFPMVSASKNSENAAILSRNIAEAKPQNSEPTFTFQDDSNDNRVLSISLTNGEPPGQSMMNTNRERIDSDLITGKNNSMVQISSRDAKVDPY